MRSRSSIIVLWLAFITQAYTKGAAASDTDGVQDPTDELLDKLIDRVVIKLSDWSFRSGSFKTLPPHDANRDNTTLFKRSNLKTSLRTSGRPLLPLRHPAAVSHLPSVHQKLILGQHLRLRETSAWAQDRPNADETLKDLDAMLGKQSNADAASNTLETLNDLDALLGTEPPTTAKPIPVTTTAAPTAAPSFFDNLVSPSPPPQQKGELSKQTSSEPASLAKNLRRFGSGLSFYLQLLLLTRIAVDIFPPPTEYRPVVEEFLYVTQIYLSAFQFAGPFAFVVGFLVLSWVRDILDDWENIVDNFNDKK